MDPLAEGEILEDGAASPEELPVEEQATRYVEKAGGIEPGDEGEEEEEQPRSRRAPIQPFGTPAHETFRRSREQRSLRQRLEDSDNRYSELQKTLDKIVKALPGAPAEDDPEPDPATQASEWILWANRQTEKRMVAKLTKVEQYIDERREADRLAAERSQTEEGFLRGLEETRSEIRKSEESYFRDVPQARAGYQQRMNWYRQSLYNSLRMAGHPHERAVAKVGQSLDGFVRDAIDSDLNPAAAFDGMVIGLLRSAYAVQNGGAAAEGEEEEPAAEAAPQEIRELREASRASVAGSISQAPRQRNGTGPIKTRKDMETAARARAAKKGIPLAAAINELLQESFSKAQGRR